MIEIFVDSVNAEVRKYPAVEMRVNPDEDDKELLEIVLDSESENITLLMPSRCAEDLFNALAVHFMTNKMEDNT